ncbi:MAG TPA: hypothetical protein VFN35_31880 [Ktedonobacteraceae bacterium]|nr:hypothetical protein [Ktedonobacteraceae bacterium]
MSVTPVKKAAVSQPKRAKTAPPTISGRTLLLVRTIWFALLLPSVGLFLFGLPSYYQLIKQGCTSAEICSHMQINGLEPTEILQRLSTHGFTPDNYALLLTLFFTLTTALWCLMGFLLFWHKANDRMALLASCFLVLQGLTVSSNFLSALTLTHPGTQPLILLLSILGNIVFYAFVLLFPHGRFTPRWAGLLLPLSAIYVVIDALPSDLIPSYVAVQPIVEPLWYIVTFGALLVVHVIRYRRYSTPPQRQQTKWVILGLIGATGTFAVLIVLSIFIPDIPLTFWGSTLWTLAVPVSFLLIPLSIGFSILRYRLYDIDVLINRTLVYGSLTLILVLVYFGLVFGAQMLLVNLLGNPNNSLVMVGSTLIVAVLFRPLRGRLQHLIDRRFYRQKYDAQRTLQTFSAALHHEVNLSQLSERVLDVVRQTVQPEQATLWLFLQKNQPPFSEE